MKKKYYPHSMWEEFEAGMWRVVSGEEKQKYIDAAADLMRSPSRFKRAALKAIENWPISCEVNLSAKSMNRQAWLGHAACCIRLKSPENCTRLGWHLLNKKEQDAANLAADQAIEIWEKRYEKAIGTQKANRNKRGRGRTKKN